MIPCPKRSGAYARLLGEPRQGYIFEHLAGNRGMAADAHVVLAPDE